MPPKPNPNQALKDSLKDLSHEALTALKANAESFRDAETDAEKEVKVEAIIETLTKAGVTTAKDLNKMMADLINDLFKGNLGGFNGALPEGWPVITLDGKKRGTVFKRDGKRLQISTGAGKRWSVMSEVQTDLSQKQPEPEPDVSVAKSGAKSGTKSGAKSGTKSGTKSSGAPRFQGLPGGMDFDAERAASMESREQLEELEEEEDPLAKHRKLYTKEEAEQRWKRSENDDERILMNELLRDIPVIISVKGKKMPENPHAGGYKAEVPPPKWWGENKERLLEDYIINLEALKESNRGIFETSPYPLARKILNEPDTDEWRNPEFWGAGIGVATRAMPSAAPAGGEDKAARKAVAGKAALHLALGHRSAGSEGTDKGQAALKAADEARKALPARSKKERETALRSSMDKEGAAFRERQHEAFRDRQATPAKESTASKYTRYYPPDVEMGEWALEGLPTFRVGYDPESEKARPRPTSPPSLPPKWHEDASSTNAFDWDEFRELQRKIRTENERTAPAREARRAARAAQRVESGASLATAAGAEEATEMIMDGKVSASEEDIGLRREGLLAAEGDRSGIDFDSETRLRRNLHAIEGVPPRHVPAAKGGYELVREPKPRLAQEEPATSEANRVKAYRERPEDPGANDEDDDAAARSLELHWTQERLPLLEKEVNKLVKKGHYKQALMLLRTDPEAPGVDKLTRMRKNVTQKMKAAGDLPADWVESYSPKEERFFYHNTATGENSLTRPTGAGTAPTLTASEAGLAAEKAKAVEKAKAAEKARMLQDKTDAVRRDEKMYMSKEAGKQARALDDSLPERYADRIERKAAREGMVARWDAAPRTPWDDQLRDAYAAASLAFQAAKENPEDEGVDSAARAAVKRGDTEYSFAIAATRAVPRRGRGSGARDRSHLGHREVEAHDAPASQFDVPGKDVVHWGKDVVPAAAAATARAKIEAQERLAREGDAQHEEVQEALRAYQEGYRPTEMPKKTRPSPESQSMLARPMTERRKIAEVRETDSEGNVLESDPISMDNEEKRRAVIEFIVMENEDLSDMRKFYAGDDDADDDDADDDDADDDDAVSSSRGGLSEDEEFTLREELSSLDLDQLRDRAVEEAVQSDFVHAKEAHLERGEEARRFDDKEALSHARDTTQVNVLKKLDDEELMRRYADLTSEVYMGSTDTSFLDREEEMTRLALEAKGGRIEPSEAMKREFDKWIHPDSARAVAGKETMERLMSEADEAAREEEDLEALLAMMMEAEPKVTEP